MKHRVSSTTRSLAALAILFALATAAFAQSSQGSQLRLDGLTALEARATKVVDVTLDESLIRMAAGVIGKHADEGKGDERKIKEFLSGLRGIYVRSYEFENEGAYSQNEVDAIRSQLRAPGWSRIAGVRSKKEGENAEVYVLTQGGKMAGLAVLAANPKELTVVNIVGTFDIETLSQFGDNDLIPGIELKRESPTTSN
jgi:hypothetical protein